MEGVLSSLLTFLLASLLTLLIGLYVLLLVRQIASEARRQSRILYEIAVVLKADIPEKLRPREGFVGELTRGLRGR